MAPVLTVTTPAQNAIFTVGQVVAPSVTCTDSRDPSPVLTVGTVDTSIDEEFVVTLADTTGTGAQ